MPNPYLTVLVLNLSSSVTLGDLNAYFSNCGHVEKIQLLGGNRDQSQSALISFRQPYAYQTALLLNNAIFAGRQIRVLPKNDAADPPVSYRTIPIVSEKTRGSIRAVADAIASEGVKALNRSRDALEHKFKLSEKSRMVMDKTRVAVCAADEAILAAEEAARDLPNRIKSTNYVAVGATWFSGVLQKTSKLVLELGNRKGHSANSRP
ncbi:DHHC-type zinc finger family protein [Hibiscus syriacus]|uniref:DHHC-type zinc finger family protein n=1 Tax=Hibiscus syriacus TaxID=106335 RepID=A0A6A3CLJ2_HIBSY|nr:DHHC-type zinc finger family protein [Hibiscus syriacus]